MRTHKIAFIFSTLICLATLLTALFLNQRSSDLDFWVNLLLGIFASSTLVMVQSGIFYRIEREERLWKLYETTVRLLNRIDRTRTKIAGRASDTVYLYDLVSDSVDYYFVEFSASSKEVSFMLSSGKLPKCVREISEGANSIYDVLRDVYGYLDDVVKELHEFDAADPRFDRWVTLQDNEIFSRLMNNASVLRRLALR